MCWTSRAVQECTAPSCGGFISIESRATFPVESIRKASTRLAAAYAADITRPQDYPFDSEPGFDVILFSDILEHVYDPVAVLRSHLEFLKPGGHVLISLPNIAIWNVRLELLFGRFRYQDTGTLDRTHIRFFNRRSFRELLTDCGLEMERSSITPGILRPFVPLIKLLYGRSSVPTPEANLRLRSWTRSLTNCIAACFILWSGCSVGSVPRYSLSKWWRCAGPRGAADS